MTKKKAIEIILTQKSKINDYGKDVLWIDQTLSYFEDFWGKDSHEYKTLYNFRGAGKPLFDSRNLKEQEEYNKQTIERLKRLLDNCTEVVNNKGLAIKPKQNFLQRFKNWQMLSFLVTVGLLIFGIGVWVGRTELSYELVKNNPKLFVAPTENATNKTDNNPASKK